jgi:hypothetical protein
MKAACAAATRLLVSLGINPWVGYYIAAAPAIGFLAILAMCETRCDGATES